MRLVIQNRKRIARCSLTNFDNVCSPWLLVRNLANEGKAPAGCYGCAEVNSPNIENATLFPFIQRFTISKLVDNAINVEIFT